MAVTAVTAKQLALKSGNRCAKPGCGSRLLEQATDFDPAVTIGQIAHIVAQSDNGPRADPSMPKEERDSEPNLVLLCPEHHLVADAQENTYSVEEMQDWKRSHEAQVDHQMEAVVSEITFLELEIVADRIASTPAPATQGFTLTEVRVKMAKNELGDRVSHDISIGMLGADLVKSYIAERSTMSPDFADRLRAGFTDEYDRLMHEGLSGDELFLGLRAFAAPPHSDLTRQAAGLSVLVHLFRICEVFEP